MSALPEGSTAPEDLPAGREGWAGRRVTVAGVGVSGFAAADALLRHGAQVTVLDAADGEVQRERGRVLEVLGATVHLGPGATGPGSLPGDADLLVVSSGWRPDAPLVVAATTAGVEVWGEVELAWRLRVPRADGTPAPWLCVTGTNGKTTTVQMLASVLRAAGSNAVAAGNVGLALCDAATMGGPGSGPEEAPADVLAVELSSFQLHWARTVAPQAAVVLNVAPDHLDWHGSFSEYARVKGLVYSRCEVACVYDTAEALGEQLVRDADVQEGCRAVGTTLGTPGRSQLGLVDDLLVDRAFLTARETSAVELASLADLPGGDRPGGPAPHVVSDALAAAALARAHGVPPRAVREGLRAFRPDAHRIAVVAEHDGVRWVDDSKATNGHAAAASLRAFDPVVWIAGGLAKGASFDDLVAGAAGRLRAVVLLGRDQDVLADALARHAPEVPVVATGRTDTGAMDEVVALAAGLAQQGDTVLLAPACASMDMFTSYAARGDVFAAAVEAHVAATRGEKP